MPPETTPSEVRTFTPDELYELASKAELSERKARAYPNRFSVGDIIHLATSSVSAKKAASYLENLSAGEIVFLVERKIAPETVLAYPPSTVQQLAAFIKGKIAAEAAGTYPERFGEDGIEILAVNGIQPTAAAAYTERFNARDVVELHRAKIRPEEAASYPPHITSGDICELVKNEISGREAAEYPVYFSGKDIVALKTNGVAAEEARAYLEAVPLKAIIEFHKKEISPETVNRYVEESKKPISDMLFFDEQLVDLIEQCVKRGTPPETTALYLENYGGVHGALALVKAGITPDTAGSYQGFSGVDIAHLVKAKIAPDVAKKFPQHLDGETIAICFKNGVLPGEVDEQFFIRFDGPEIRSLLTARVPVSQALDYPDRFSGQQIARFVRIGIGPDDADASDLEGD